MEDAVSTNVSEVSELPLETIDTSLTEEITEVPVGFTKCSFSEQEDDRII